MRSLLPSLALLLAAAVSSQAHDGEVTPKPKLLQRGVPQKEIRAEDGEGIVYRIDVPEGAKKLTFRTLGGTGDCDLYVRHNAHPNPERYDFASFDSRNNEEVEVNSPDAGPWYVLLEASSAFRNVTLKGGFSLDPGVIPAPRLAPDPGIFPGKAKVKIAKPTQYTTARFTTDNSQPTAQSPTFSTPLVLTEDTIVRAKAFKKNGASGIEITGAYDIRPSGEVGTLINGTAVHHLAGDAGADHLYKITVPEGQALLRFAVEGGAGGARLYVKRGGLPTINTFDYRTPKGGGNATIDVTQPAAGEWFVRLHSNKSFSRYSVLAMVRPPGPDLITWQPSLDPFLSTETFNALDCEVQEGMIEVGTHRLLRFSTETRNIGGQDMILPNPVGNPNFEFQECHGHYHFKGFASYRLLNSEGTEVATGRKVSFCLEDIIRWDPKSDTSSFYDCENQGIQSGWADVYDGGLPGQWIDVTNVPNGVYTLEVTMNPQHILEEADYTNNTATIQVEIGLNDD